MSISFTSGASATFVNSGTSVVHTGLPDFNGDGIVDLVLAPLNWPPSTVELSYSIFQGVGDGTFLDITGSVANGSPNTVNAREFIAADFNGDGLDDLFIADHGYDADPFPGHQNSLLLSNGGGILNATSTNLPQQSDMTHSAGAGDVDGDGDLDLVIGNVYGQNLYDPEIWLNNGSGVFSVSAGALPSSLVDISAGANKYSHTELVDLNGDGYADLVLGADNGHGNTSILYNDGSGIFSSVFQTIAGPFGTASAAVDVDSLDLNTDGRTDLLVTYYSGATFTGSYTQVLIQQTDGTFVDETSTRLANNDTSSSDWRVWVDLADFDGDGDLDAFATYSGATAGNPEIWTNEGGVFTTTVLSVNSFVQGHIGDVDGNGTPDIVSAGNGVYQVFVNTAANPQVAGTSGSETLTGSGFKNVIYAYDGNDTINGGFGDDILYGNRETDYLNGDDGDDTLYGGQNDGPESAGVGNASDSTLRQREGIETIVGGAGDDVIYGNYGSDQLHGGSGSDKIYGGQDNDTLYGDDGNDTLFGNRGDDTLFGGNGRDLFVIQTNTVSTVTISDFAAGTDLISAGAARTSVVDGGVGAVITFVNGSIVTLVGVAASSVSDSFFA